METIIDDDWDDEESEEDFDDIIRAKWSMDGATTLADAAQRLRAFADRIDALDAEGWVLRHEIDDDYGFIYRPEAHE